jgi:TolA-binding protein
MYMRTTVTLDDAQSEHVDAVRTSPDESDAAAVRRCVERSQQLAECQERIGELETEVERVQNEKRLILDQQEEHSELVRVVEEERSLQERKARAGLGQRMKWAIFGMDE